MVRKHNKRGEINFDILITTAFIVSLVVIALTSGIFYYNSCCVERRIKDYVPFSYNNVLTRVRLDSHQAVAALTASSSVVFLDKNSDQICKYELKDNKLLRFDRENTETVFLEGVEEVKFFVKEDLPNLFTLCIFPNDKNKIPFFTSFALRGLNNDMQ